MLLLYRILKLFLFQYIKALKNVTRKKPRKAATENILEIPSSSKVHAPNLIKQTVEKDPPTASSSSEFQPTTDHAKKVFSSPHEPALPKAEPKQLAEEQGGKGEQLRILNSLKVSL